MRASRLIATIWKHSQRHLNFDIELKTGDCGDLNHYDMIACLLGAPHC